MYVLKGLEHDQVIGHLSDARMLLTSWFAARVVAALFEVAFLGPIVVGGIGM